MAVECGKVGVIAEHQRESSVNFTSETQRSEVVEYRLSVSDLLRVIGKLRTAGNIPHFIIFIDEFVS
jgi:hypothetical protein